MKEKAPERARAAYIEIDGFSSYNPSKPTSFRIWQNAAPMASHTQVHLKFEVSFYVGYAGSLAQRSLCPFFTLNEKKKVHTRERCAELERQDWGEKPPPPPPLP